MTPYVVAIVGPSGSGKTRLIERLVPLLNKRGLKVGAVKHAHDRIDLDQPGKDSWRHLQAGAEAAAVVGPRQLLLIKRLEAEGGLQEALEGLPAEVDLVLLEGFHEADYPQIILVGRGGRARGGRPPAKRLPGAPACRQAGAGRVIATVSEEPIRHSGRWFRPDQISELAAFIEEEWMKRWEASRRCPSQVSSSAVG